MDPKPESEHDRIVRNIAALLNTAQWATISLDGVPLRGVRLVRLTKEQLEKVHGSENEATG